MIDLEEMVVWFVILKKKLAYNYKHNFRKNTESIFNYIFLPETKPILVSILYRPPDKINIVKNLKETFTGCNILEKQEGYLLGDFNINLLHNGENIFEKRGHKSKLRLLPFLVKEYLDFAYSYSLQQLISVPTRITENTATLTDYVLTIHKFTVWTDPIKFIGSRTNILYEKNYQI